MDFLVNRIIKTFLTVLLAAAILLGVVFGIISIWHWYTNQPKTETPPTTEEPTDTPPQDTDQILSVNVIKANLPTNQPAPLPEKTTPKTGIITADQSVSVYVETTAILQNLKIKEGDKVEAGDQLATIGNSLQLELTKSSYNSALESLKLAEESLRLTQTTSNITESTFSNQLQSAQLNLRQAIQQLENSQLVRFQQDVITQIGKDIKTETPIPEPTTTETTDTTTLDQLQKSLEISQQNLANSQAKGQDVQSHYQIINSQNQLNLLLKQLESQKVQSELQEINALNQINQIRQQLETAKINLDASKIASPISGVVTQITVDTGDRVTPNAPILTITNFNSIVVQISLTPEELFQLNPEATATIELLNQQIPAKIIFTSPIADPQTKTITVKVAPKEATNLPLIPNTFATVTFQNPSMAEPTTTNQTGFIFPIGLVKFRDRKAYVPVVQDNKIVYKPIIIDSINNGTALIVSGIQNGDLIVIHPRLLPENMPVNIIQWSNWSIKFTTK